MGRFTVVNPVIDYDKLGVGRKAISREIVLAYLFFYTRPSYMFRHPYLFSMIPHAIFPHKRSRKENKDMKKTAID